MKTSYRDHGASELMAYISRDGQAIKDRTGRELSVGEQADFISQSESYEFARSIIVSPDHGEELTDRELELRTRQSMREFARDRPSARHVYAVHRDTDHPHAHVLLTGTKEDLYMDRDDIDHVRLRTTEHFRDVERAAVREQDQERHYDRAVRAEAQAEPDRQDYSRSVAGLEPER